MIKVKVGDIISIEKNKTGESDGRTWFMTNVKAEKGYDAITIFAQNGYEAANFRRKAAKIKEIVEAKVSARQYNGKWYTTYALTCVLEEAAMPLDGIEGGMESVDDAELPFD